jgi:hypothetical protein
MARHRPLEGRFPYLWLDGLMLRCREGGRTVQVALVVAIGVTHEGRREILGADVITSEDKAGWLAFLKSLVARGLTGVQLVVSDAHGGLRDAIASVLLGTSWQLCRTHFMTNLLSKVPKAAQHFVATGVRSIFAQPDAEAVREQHRHVVDQRHPRFAETAEPLDETGDDLLAFTAFPGAPLAEQQAWGPRRPWLPAAWYPRDASSGEAQEDMMILRGTHRTHQMRVEIASPRPAKCRPALAMTPSFARGSFDSHFHYSSPLPRRAEGRSDTTLVLTPVNTSISITSWDEHAESPRTSRRISSTMPCASPARESPRR